ncbi:hypothetical protein MASR2M78_25450 [Treponema sp.]
MSDADLALLPIFLPLIGAAFALIAKAWDSKLSLSLEYIGAASVLLRPSLSWPFSWIAVRSGGLSFIVGSRGNLLGIEQRFDAITWLMDLLGFTGAAFAWLYSRGTKTKGPLFTMLFLLQTAALAATASCADLFNLFVCLELLGMASYALTASSEKGAAFLASFSYLAISSMAMCFFLFGVFGFYQLTGSLSYTAISAALSSLGGEAALPAALSLACLVAATAVRVAVLPVYGWLPDAHAMAPHAVSAVLSGVLIKTPLFALGRLLDIVAKAGGFSAQLAEKSIMLLGIAGSLTALSAVLVALWSKDAGRL